MKVFPRVESMRHYSRTCALASTTMLACLHNARYLSFYVLTVYTSGEYQIKLGFLTRLPYSVLLTVRANTLFLWCYLLFSQFLFRLLYTQ